MKQCPKCSFANAERYPACVMCNTAIYDVESTVPGPGDPDYPQWALNLKRNRALDRQERSASVLYALSITGGALYPGLVFDPWVLLVYLLGALAVGWGVRRLWIGPFIAALCQGGLSLVALMFFGPGAAPSFLHVGSARLSGGRILSLDPIDPGHGPVISGL